MLEAGRVSELYRLSIFHPVDERTFASGALISIR